MTDESRLDEHWETQQWLTPELVEANPTAFFDALVHDLLPDEIAQQLRQRIAENPEWQAQLAAAERFQARLAAVPPESPSPSVALHVAQQLEPSLSRWRGFRRVLVRTYATLAASLLILAGIHAWVYTSRPSDIDLRLVSQSTVMAGSPGVVQLTSYRKSTGDRIESIPVVVSLLDARTSRKLQLASFETGQTPPNIQWPDWEAGQYRLLIEAEVEGQTEVLDQSVRIERPMRVFLTSDKPIYQPGQTIHLRSISLRQPSGQPIENEPCTFRIVDSRRNIIFKQLSQTSSFGIAHADCPLAAELNLGEYRIECEIGSTQVSQPIRVERYVLPKLGVTVKLDRSFYAPGDQVNAEIDASYFFGEPVREGRITLKMSDHRFESIALPEHLQTDAQGKARVSFQLPATLASTGRSTTRLELTCEVSDTAGQSAARVVPLTVADQPIQIEVIPGSTTLAVDQANEVFIYTCFADGQPAETTVVINDGQHELRTSPLGIAKLSIQPTTPDLRWTLQATDAKGQTGRRNVAFAAAEGMLLLRTDKVVYQSGDTIFVQALVSGTGKGTDPIFVDVVKQNQSMFHTTLRMDTTGADRGKTSLTLPPEVHGTLQLIAYRYDREGQLQRFSRLIHVAASERLRIQASASQSRYRPGELARLKLQVTDGQGLPVQAALGVVAVDEAFYGLLSGRTSLEQALALIEQDLLKPGYMIYPAWEWRPGDPIPVEPVPNDFWTVMTEGIFARAGNFLNSSDAAHQASNPFFEPEKNSNEWDQPTGQPFANPIRPLNLQVSDYSRKLNAFQQQKQQRIQTLQRIWTGLIGIICLVSWLTLLMRFPKFTLVISFASVLALVLCLPLAEVRHALKSDVALAPSSGVPMRSQSDAEPGTETEDAALEGPSPRLRTRFPETLLWLPEVITDEKGHCEIEIPLADSITRWRVDLNAVTKSGAVGGQTAQLEVFQPFFVDINTPAYLTLQDQVRIPIVVYNYLDTAQTVRISVLADAWYTSSQDPDATGHRVLELDIDARSTNRVELPLTANQLGRHSLRVTAVAGEVADAIERTIEVLPGGRRFEHLTQGSLSTDLQASIAFPPDAIPGSQRVQVKLVPSTFSLIVEGLDSIFSLPHGCFEQTSSTSYPNVLALRFLRDANLNQPEVEAKAMQYIHTGFQRLLTFEIAGGGFDWFGRAPANLTLSAYGLMQFEDTASVADIDRGVLDRTRSWLKQRLREDGSFVDEDRGFSGMPAVGDAVEQTLLRTAYVAWALNRNQYDPEMGATRSFLLSHRPADIRNSVVLATTLNALIAMKATDQELDPYFAALIERRQTDEAGTLTWWSLADQQQAVFYSQGTAANVEATALAVLACVAADRHLELMPQAIDYLLKQRQAAGRWSTTQGTILSLQALIAANRLTRANPQPYEVEVFSGADLLASLKVEAGQFDVVQSMILPARVLDVASISVRERTGQRINAEVIQSYHRVVPEPETRGALAIDVTYSRETFAIDQTIDIDVMVTNQTGRTLPMVMLDLPIPPGFRIDRDEWEQLVSNGRIARFEMTPRQILVYLRDLDDRIPLQLKYQGTATMPIRAQVPAASVYEYYNPEQRGSGGAAALNAGEM